MFALRDRPNSGAAIHNTYQNYSYVLCAVDESSLSGTVLISVKFF
jgi:hypothetical protein